MWTSKSRARYDHGKLRYPSDLTDAEWQLVKPLISITVAFFRPIRIIIEPNA